MTSNRREFITTIGILGGVLALPTLAFATKVQAPLSIGSLLSVSFSAVKAHMLGGQQWASPVLRQAATDGRLLTQPLGAVVLTDGLEHPVSALSIPMCWSKRDEEINVTEASKLHSVRALLENAFEMHDVCLAERLGTGRAIASQHYRYDLGQVMSLSEGELFGVKMYTAIAFLDSTPVTSNSFLGD